MNYGLWSLLAVIPLTASATSPLEDAHTLWLKGNYGEALEKYEQLKDADPALVALGKGRCLSSEGKYTEARALLAEALTKAPKNADLLAAVAEIDCYHGQYDKAREGADKAIEIDGEHLPARWLRAELLTIAGQQEKANGEFEWFINYYNDKQPTEPEKLLLVARAAAEFARWNKLSDEFDFILNTLLVDASAANPDFWQANWYAGTLLLEKYNKTEGVPELKNALAINPSSAEALVGLGTAALQGYDFVEGNNFADQALAINPNLLSGFWLKADLLLGDSKTDEALAQLQKALAINPVREETLGRLAACYYLKRMPDKTDQLEKDALGRNPKPGVFYYHLADQLEQRRQFDPAEKYFLKAIELTPYLAAPKNGLGMLYMRVGKEDEARKIFEQARQLDPFHVRVLNMSKVLKHMEGYKIIQTEHYEVYVRPDLDDLLGKYMAEYLEETHDELCKRFGFQPKGRTKIEILMDHAWFSARVVGLPNIGTVGACTGNVVALASPRSLKTPYNWARVLTHEVTHVITLQQTNYNISHWFTEALAVHAEGYPRPEVWNQLLVERVPKGELLNLDTINHAFVRPKTPLDWQMAYCQSLLYAEYMMKKFGEPTIAKLLDAYRDGIETDEAVPKVFGVSKEKFEEGYRDYLKDVVANLKTGPVEKKLSFAEAERAYRDKPNDPDLAAQLAMHHFRRKNNIKARELAQAALDKQKNHPLALSILANMELSIGKVDEALAIVEPAFDPKNPNEQALELLAGIRLRKKEYAKAAELFDLAHKSDPLNRKWVEGLARVYLLQNENDKLAPILKTLAGMDADNITVRKKLAELAAKAKQWQEAERWAKQTLYVDVSDPEAHRILADAAFEQKKYSVAAGEYQVVTTLNPKDKEAPLKLAEAYKGAGELDKARAQLRSILETDPDNEQAKKLLAEVGQK